MGELAVGAVYLAPLREQRQHLGGLGRQDAGDRRAGPSVGQPAAGSAPLPAIGPDLSQTFDDLRAAPRILDELLQVPGARCLAQTGRRMEIMLGYSDSAKDVGPVVSATLAIDVAQEAITAWAQRNDIRLTLFHGKCGALGRGGGLANRAILAQPPLSVDGLLQAHRAG